jgi:glycosyltransferase involved in cell wall biosynthesis
VKILQIVSGQFVNGALVHVDLLTRELLDRGHQVKLVCRPRSWIWRRLFRTGIEMKKSSLNRFPPRELIRIADWIRQEKFDVIHTHMSSAHFFGVLLRAMTGVPVVATAHTSHFQLHWRFNDLVIANSQSTRDYQLQFNRVPPHKLVTIPCFVDLTRFRLVNPSTRKQARRELGIFDERPTVGIVGAVTARKGQLEFVKSLSALIERFPDLKVVLIGQFEKSAPYYKKIRRYLYENKLFRRVVWVGRRNNVDQLIQSLDVCVVPSLKEPLGLCALEAMAANIPVVAARVGGLAEFVIDQETGLSFDPRQPQQIADQVTRMLVDQELRRRVTGNAQLMLDDQFSPSRIVDRIETALLSVTPKAPAAGMIQRPAIGH